MTKTKVAPFYLGHGVYLLLLTMKFIRHDRQYSTHTYMQCKRGIKKKTYPKNGKDNYTAKMVRYFTSNVT